MSVPKLAGNTISIIWALSWNTPRPSLQHHYNSPMVNNHKSNEIHKPLRWCLLSLILGGSDIHGLEVRAFGPIIRSIYVIFPSFYRMNYALCHNLPEHFSSQESYAVLDSFSQLAHLTTMHHLSPSSELLPSLISWSFSVRYPAWSHGRNCDTQQGMCFSGRICLHQASCC